MGFKKGSSGNPKGRPPGTTDKRTELRELLRPHAPVLMQTAVNLALSGDTTALRLCLDRCIPTVKATGMPIAAAIPTDGTLAERAEAIFAAASRGEMPLDQAGELMTLLTGQTRIVEATEILERIERLEAEHEKRR